MDVLPQPRLEVSCYFGYDSRHTAKGLSIETVLRDGKRILARSSKHIERDLQAESRSSSLSLTDLGDIMLWDLRNPKLYHLDVILLDDGHPIDQDSRRIGFREASFTEPGFSLNGKIVKLRGLDRHQTFPYVGQAMPARVQRRDADILRNNFRCNIVRTSHYPQSRHFLDRCDEVGLLVLEEIPGWHHIGDRAWQDLALDNVSRMIRRDWNHPSVILWGVRINESRDNHDFYARTNALAHELDASRQTGGIRNSYASECLEDVFTMNDFRFPLKAPNHPLYLNTEFVGHTFPCKTTDSSDHVREHTLRHVRIHDQLASNAQYAGGIGWCAFDYNTHTIFGSGDRVCYHGVADIFREPKPAAGFYKSQCDPVEEIVLEPAFRWAPNHEPTGFTTAMVCSNCDHLKFYIDRGQGFQLVVEVDPDRKQFPNLRYAPFMPTLRNQPQFHGWGDLRIEGYIDNKLVITKTYSGKGVYGKFLLVSDDKELIADGADTTRVVLKVVDSFGDAVQVLASEVVTLELDGPAELIGDNPSSLVGGTMAVWIRAKEQTGLVRLRAKHPYLGTQEIHIAISEAPLEIA